LAVWAILGRSQKTLGKTGDRAWEGVRWNGQRRWKLKGSVSLMITTGKQIKAARAALNWTQGDLAERAKLHFKAVAYWERHDTITPRQCHDNSGPARMLAAFQSAGVDLVSFPQLAVLFER